jgi:hypothetical protein
MRESPVVLSGSSALWICAALEVLLGAVSLHLPHPAGPVLYFWLFALVTAIAAAGVWQQSIWARNLATAVVIVNAAIQMGTLYLGLAVNHVAFWLILDGIIFFCVWGTESAREAFVVGAPQKRLPYMPPHGIVSADELSRAERSTWTGPGGARG